MNSQTNFNSLSTAFLFGATFVSSAVAQPIITTQPSDVSVSLGAKVTFQVGTKSMAPPLSFQWRFNNLQLLSATNRSLVLTNIRVLKKLPLPQQPQRHLLRKSPPARL